MIDPYVELEQRTKRLKRAIRVAFANDGFELSMAERDLAWIVALAEERLDHGYAAGSHATAKKHASKSVPTPVPVASPSGRRA